MAAGGHSHEQRGPHVRMPGQCEISLVSRPEYRVCEVLVRMVKDLPYRLITGAVFIRKHGSVVCFVDGGLQLSPETPWVPFVSSTVPPPSKTTERRAAWAGRQQPNQAS